MTPVATTTAIDVDWGEFVADVEIRGIYVHVRECHVIKTAVAERFDGLVEAFTDPRNLGFRDP